MNFTAACFSVVGYRPCFPVAEDRGFSLMEMDLLITETCFIGGHRRDWGNNSAYSKLVDFVLLVGAVINTESFH